MKAAKLMWIKGLQNKMVSEENFEMKPADLGVYCDENGLIRCKGRFQNSQLTHNEKHPILIPPRERITELIVMEMHWRTGHGGVNCTLAEVRSEYWIIKGLQMSSQSSEIFWCASYF